MDRGLALRVYLVLMLAMTSAGCDLVEGIFKAGFFVALFVVGLAVLLVLFLVAKVRR